MEFFSISVSTIILRFFLMMAVIILGVFIGQYWLAALGLPIFLSVMLGLGVKPKAEATKAAKRSNIQPHTKAA
ncbi:hypothetical protein [Lewinella sp. LCG006]|uniref:hypothetical protein n=1 Tax=Lewinella sp. LCG006 TaxID=3231911 RepID=UPI00346057FB